MEVEWDRMGSEVEAVIGGPPPIEKPGGVSDELTAEAATEPSVAVLAAHAAVDRTLRQLLAATDIPTTDVNRAAGTVGVARLARERNLITQKSLEAIEGIAVMRNLAAHGSGRDVTTEQAQDYLHLVDAILYVLRRGA